MAIPDPLTEEISPSREAREEQIIPWRVLRLCESHAGGEFRDGVIESRSDAGIAEKTIMLSACSASLRDSLARRLWSRRGQGILQSHTASGGGPIRLFGGAT